jgi:hypothetical protein
LWNLAGNKNTESFSRDWRGHEGTSKYPQFQFRPPNVALLVSLASMYLRAIQITSNSRSCVLLVLRHKEETQEEEELAFEVKYL